MPAVTLDNTNLPPLEPAPAPRPATTRADQPPTFDEHLQRASTPNKSDPPQATEGPAKANASKPEKSSNKTKNKISEGEKPAKAEPGTAKAKSSDTAQDAKTITDTAILPGQQPVVLSTTEPVPNGELETTSQETAGGDKVVQLAGAIVKGQQIAIPVQSSAVKNIEATTEAAGETIANATATYGAKLELPPANFNAAVPAEPIEELPAKPSEPVVHSQVSALEQPTQVAAKPSELQADTEETSKLPLDGLEAPERRAKPTKAQARGSQDVKASKEVNTNANVSANAKASIAPARADSDILPSADEIALPDAHVAAKETSSPAGSNKIEPTPHSENTKPLAAAKEPDAGSAVRVDGPQDTRTNAPARANSQHVSASAVSNTANVADVDRSRFVQRVTKAFQTASERGGPLRLRLSPPELGSLRLEVSVRAGVVTAKLEAETPAARSMLLDNLPALRERLAEHQIRIERFDVDLLDNGTGGDSGGPHEGGQARQEPQRQNMRPAPKAPADQIGDRAAARPGRPGAEQLNILI